LNLFSTSSDIKDDGDGANPKDEQEESDDFLGNAILMIGTDVVRYLYHLPFRMYVQKGDK